MDKTYQQSKDSCLCCCLLCCRLTSRELTAYNQIYALLCISSVLTPRVSRLALLYLGVLVEFAICAFFFDLDEASAELAPSSPFTLAHLQDNFWVGLYAVALAFLPLSLLTLFFRTPRAWKRSLREAAGEGRLASEYERLRGKAQCPFVGGLAVFVGTSLFFCLYLVGFCEMANARAEQDWMVSSLISVGIDMAAFELLPAVTVGCVGLCVAGCRLSCLVCVVALIKCSRGIRNIAGA